MANGKSKAFTTRVFDEFHKLAKARLEAVREGLSDAEIPAPPESKKRGTPVPPAVSTPKFGDMQ